jgi:hypothetical protein
MKKNSKKENNKQKENSRRRHDIKLTKAMDGHEAWSMRIF